MPLLRETMTLMPVSTNGTENSTTSDLSSLMVREPMAMSALLDTTWKTWRLELEWLKEDQKRWQGNFLFTKQDNKLSLQIRSHKFKSLLLFSCINFYRSSFYLIVGKKNKICELYTLLQSIASRLWALAQSEVFKKRNPKHPSSVKILHMLC